MELQADLKAIFDKARELIDKADESTKDIQKDLAGKTIEVVNFAQTKLDTFKTWLQDFKDKN